MPSIVHRPCAAGNFRRGRAAPIDQITIHVTEGNAASVRSWFANPAAQVSAHYMVTKAGGVEQFVDEGDTAYHNGRVDHPTAPLVRERPNINPNAYAIGIEHEGTGTEDLTPQQRLASIELIADIIRRHPAIQVNRRHIVGHHEVYSKKTCPGKIDVDLLVGMVAAAVRAPQTIPVAPAAARPFQPRVVWSEYLHDYLVVVRIVNETDWYFIPSKALGSMQAVAKAEAPLSQMPRVA